MRKFIIVLITVLALCIGVVAVNMVINELALTKFSKQLFHAELPAAVTINTQFAQYGFITNDHAGFVARLEVDYPWGEKALEEQIDKLVFQSAFGGKQIKAEVIPKNFILETAGSFLYEQNANPLYYGSDNVYYLQIHDQGYNPYLDLRGYKTFSFLSKKYNSKQF